MYDRRVGRQLQRDFDGGKLLDRRLRGRRRHKVMIIVVVVVAWVIVMALLFTPLLLSMSGGRVSGVALWASGGYRLAFVLCGNVMGMVRIQRGWGLGPR